MTSYILKERERERERERQTERERERQREKAVKFSCKRTNIRVKFW
jgi:hypothetical protein